jgi:protein-tyrosine phosphatase
MNKQLLQQLKRAADAHVRFSFCEEYYTSYQPETCSVAHQPLNYPKNQHNRWGFPYDHNLIQSIPHYINASPMQFGPHRYIAAQGPRANTFNEFWHMVWSEQVSLIVSVTNETEESRKGWNQFKFERFWPAQGQERFGDITVEFLNEDIVQEWDGRPERLVRRSFIAAFHQQLRTITHLHMENWMDGNIIHPDSLYHLSLHADRHKQNGAIAVHCAAGVGRTGTFIAFHSLYHDLMKFLKGEFPMEQHGEFDVPGRIEAMRKLRWGAMVAEPKQYHLLIETLELALSRFQE